jgi:hypothetical protein
MKVAEAAVTGMAQRAEQRQSAGVGHLAVIGSALLIAHGTVGRQASASSCILQVD